MRKKSLWSWWNVIRMAMVYETQVKDGNIANRGDQAVR